MVRPAASEARPAAACAAASRSRCARIVAAAFRSVTRVLKRHRMPFGSSAQGDGTTAGPTVVAGFKLSPASAEIALVAGGQRWMVPIRVADLELLLVGPGMAGLDLRALLALLGRRVGGERLSTLMIQRGPAGVATALEAVFGEGFGPTCSRHGGGCARISRSHRRSRPSGSGSTG